MGRNSQPAPADEGWQTHDVEERELSASGGGKLKL